MGERRRDIVMWKRDRKLLVEVVVTDDLTDEKRRWIRQNDLATIRVDLSWVGYEVNEGILLHCMRTGRTVKVTPEFNIVHWVHHPKKAAAQSKVNDEYLRSIQTSSIVQPGSEPAGRPPKTQKQFQF
jgi:hypothetical protein